MTSPHNVTDSRRRQTKLLCNFLFHLLPRGDITKMYELIMGFDERFNRPPLGDDNLLPLVEESYKECRLRFDGPLKTAMRRFLGQECVTDFDFYTTTVRTKTATLFRAFRDFVARNNLDLEPLTIQKFGRTLTELGYGTKHTSKGNCRCIVLRR